jgi:hypothetical protein
LTSASIQAGTLTWALDYVGDSAKGQLFFRDPRILHIVATDLGPLLDRGDLAGFRGIPYPVHVIDSRYVWSFSCKPHECPYNRGFVWLDTKSGTSIVAHFAVTFPRRRGLELEEFHELRIGGSVRKIDELPATGLNTLKQWLTENQQRIDRVVYRGRIYSRPVRPTELSPKDFFVPEVPAD